MGKAPQRARDPQTRGVRRDMKLLGDLLVAELVKDAELKRGTGTRRERVELTLERGTGREPTINSLKRVIVDQIDRESQTLPRAGLDAFVADGVGKHIASDPK